jgi:basic membrane lipoprotein Med (substrate-binding protein (PBP1-ABC) superfamily)
MTVYTFGANSNQNDNPVCPNYTLGSAVINMDIAFGRVIKEVKEGKFKPGHVIENIETGGAAAVINPKLVGKVIDKETEKLVEDAGKKIAAKELKVPPE